MTVAVRTSLLSCREAGKTRVFMPVRESSGESRLVRTRQKRNTPSQFGVHPGGSAYRRAYTMRLPLLISAILGCGVLAIAQPAAAASSCPGGGTPVNCKPHCTLTNPPVCTETCECAITGAKGDKAGKVTGTRAKTTAPERPPRNPTQIPPGAPKSGATAR